MMAAALAASFSACGGKAPKATNAESPTEISATAGNPHLKTLHTAKADITWIQDNAQEKRMPRTLFADASDELIDSLALQDGIPSTVSTFFVETAGARILFDTGLGAPDSRLLAGLSGLGVSPSDVEYLYLTHFHGDHIGGMMKGDSVVFPNAEVYAAKAEYDAWMKMPEAQKAMVEKTMEAYKGRLHLFEFGDTLPGNVVAIEAVGHTPGHTAYLCGKVIVIADLMHGAALQARYPEYSSNYDMDKDKAAQSRKRILQYAADNGLTMAGMHLPAPAFMK